MTSGKTIDHFEPHPVLIITNSICRGCSASKVSTHSAFEVVRERLWPIFHMQKMRLQVIKCLRAFSPPTHTVDYTSLRCTVALHLQFSSGGTKWNSFRNFDSFGIKDLVFSAPQMKVKSSVKLCFPLETVLSSFLLWELCNLCFCTSY